MILEYGEEYLERFIKKLNKFRLTIELAAEYQKENKGNFSDLDIRLKDRELKTNFFVKPTDTH